MAYKFEQLNVWNDALEYTDLVYKIAESLPKSEDYNLKSQIIRAATSVALNIAEGSTGQSDAEQAKFLGLAIRSLVETVACLHLIRRRGYLTDVKLFNLAYQSSERLFARLQAFRKRIQVRRIRDVGARKYLAVRLPASKTDSAFQELFDRVGSRGLRSVVGRPPT